MISAKTLRPILLAGAAAIALGACSDTDIASPGGTTPLPPPPPAAPPPPPPPPPPTASTIDLVPAAGCPAGTTAADFAATGALASVSACAISGNITSDVTIPASVGTIAINGPTFVGDQASGATATLTIEPGVRLFGSVESDFLSVLPGSQIAAVGNATTPIVFTARADVNDSELGTNIIDDDDRGLWGGLIVNGNAPINDCSEPTATPGSADCTAEGEGGTGVYGGDVADDNSGSLQFIQVLYAGNEITPMNELNGIAFQGVGSGTTINNIQVFNNDDDGVEFFGGTASAKFVALNGNEDDSLDWTDGWTGNLQFVLITHSDTADNGIEADNNEDSDDELPRSNPTISNLTLIGSGNGDLGILVREGTAGTIVNGVIAPGFPDGGIAIDDAATVARLTGTGADGDELLQFASFVIDNDTPFVEDDAMSTALADNVTQDIVLSDATLQSEAFPGPQEQAVDVFTALPAFFDTPDVVGAFRLTDTPESNWATGWTFGLVPDVVVDCPAGTTDVTAAFPTASAAQGDATVCEVPENILTDLTLTSGPIYTLTGSTFIGVDAGPDPAAPIAGAVEASLTIEAGVTLFGTDTAAFLTVNRGSQLFSNGTVSAPVVMTSQEDVEGTSDASDNGQWGGLIINGRAPINDCGEATATPGSVDCEAEGEGGTGVFGGATPTDDSGNLFFTQVRYAGNEITPMNELNGIAFQAVGSGTDVDSIQVHNNDDDGIEFFGGTVSVSRALLTGNEDDSIDWTDGWTGSLQFAVVQHSLAIVGDQGIEADNNEDADAIEPRSNPVLSNITLIGDNAGSDIGALFREGTSVTMVNSVVANFGVGGLDIEDAITFDQVVTPTGSGDTTPDTPLTLSNWFLSNPTNFVENPAEDLNSDGMLVDLSDTFGPNDFVEGTADFVAGGPTFVAGIDSFVPGPTILATPAIDPTTVDSRLEAGSFVGAVSGADDTSFDGWTFTELN
ncbi:MAG: hypothetical protein AAFX03_13240 [Pseudomonadota bacterium]